MNEHKIYSELLPFYITDQLSDEQHTKVERHLQKCALCQSDLALWQTVSNEVVTANQQINYPQGIVDIAIRRIQTPSPFRRACLRTLNLVRVQTHLVRGEMWPASAVVMALAVIVIFLIGKIEVLRFIAPIVAAASLAVIFGPEHDPAYELTLATPTSPWKVLLARMTLVYSYNLFLALTASFILLLTISPDVLGILILAWLGPMTFLSALALFLSLWVGTIYSIAVTYALWIIQFPSFEVMLSTNAAQIWLPIINLYRQFWSSPWLLIGLGAILAIAALWFTKYSTPRISVA